MFGRRSYFFILGFAVLFPLFSLAAAQPASIVTRPGVATPPVKYYFDFSSALAEGVNHSLKVTVSASNAEKTAVRFESVQLFGADGGVLGNNVASKTDALSSTPYSFVFQNFGVPAADLEKVAGVQLAFLDLGGENPTGRVTVQGVAVSVERGMGEACVIADPFVPLKPVITVKDIQTQRKLISVGGGGTSGCSALSSTKSGGQGQNGAANGNGLTWTDPSYIISSNNLYAVSYPSNGAVDDLNIDTFNFSIPAGATINGITLAAEVYGYDSGSNPAAYDYKIRLLKNGVLVGDNKARGAGSLWPTSDTTITFGGSGDLWGTTWTVSDISTIGAAIASQINSSGQTGIDHVTMTVTYTPSTCASVYDSFRTVMQALLEYLKLK